VRDGREMRMKMMVRKAKERMIELGGYGGSYVDDVEDDVIILNGVAAP